MGWNAILESVRGRGMGADERCKLSIQLAEQMLEHANAHQTAAERGQQAELARMMDDVHGKIFTTAMTDQAFRTESTARVADQINYLLDRFGVPRFLAPHKRLGFSLFRHLSPWMHRFFVPMTKAVLRREVGRVILPGEEKELSAHMGKRRQQGVRVNLNHLGEAILGEEEARKRLQTYLDDLARPEVEYISIKISTMYSQISLLAWEQTLAKLAERLRVLYRAANSHEFVRADGSRVPKFVNLDMEEYRDLHLTVELFMRVLSEPEFAKMSAGIVLQSYLPDSFALQQTLTEWAMRRSAPIKIRIVKGANLAMERVDASLHGWPQAPYTVKADVDANYKRMVSYGCQPAHARAAHLGIASHNLFDIAHALLIRSQNEVEEFVGFEMLEGMADHLRRTVQEVAGDMLLYCPAAGMQEFQNAVAYLVRRLDENTAPENFLRHQFRMEPRSNAWNQQVKLFKEACRRAEQVTALPRRTQNRSAEVIAPDSPAFENEADTDWSLSQNQRWAAQIVQEFRGKAFGHIPMVIGGQEVFGETGVGRDPSFSSRDIYNFEMADKRIVDKALECAQGYQATWDAVGLEEREAIGVRAAQLLRERRGELIGMMIADAGKVVSEGDVEVSEAIDFAEYYRRSLRTLHGYQGVRWHAKGVTVVTPPWNFPLAIPFGGVLAALLTGNCVIFKPAPETVLVGYQVARLLWDAGVPPEALQFIQTRDNEVGNHLISDPRVKQVILTGATATARHFLAIHHGVDLIAETGGKNAIIVSKMSDRDLAIKSVVQSAFGHAGQKCSAASLLILEAEVYDDPNFRKQLRDAAGSLTVGSAWEPTTSVGPLIRPPKGVLLEALQQLEAGESWLLEPRVDSENPRLWSPGIKWGVTQSSATYKNELFGPCLAVMRAKDLDEAIELANGVSYGLTTGLQSLDPREQDKWLHRIEAGNLYINRGITGAIVQRQPFGGTKQSGFGRGSKAGGPNYLLQMMRVEEQSGTAKDYEAWYENYFSKDHDASLLVGEDNLLRYVPHHLVIFRVCVSTTPEDIERVKRAAAVCGTPLEISDKESEADLIARLPGSGASRLYMTEQPSLALWEALIPLTCRLHVGKPLASGRLELLNFLREVSICVDYHRYGNLEEREGESRKSVL